MVKIVKEKQGEKAITTLAIGDGANDVNMINAAHVGVGISGLEGQQAARSADYAIGQFKFLKNLMFVHGREAYRRNGWLLGYFFYKNCTYVLPLFYYGLFSEFSATNFYDVNMYMYFNILFTGMPAFFYGFYDWQFPKEKYLAEPRHYKFGLQRRAFNVWVFARWIFSTICLSVLIFVVCFQTMETRHLTFSYLDYDKSAHNYQYGGLDDTGALVMSAMVWMANIKIFISSYSHTWLSILWITGSIGWFYLFEWILSLPSLVTYDYSLTDVFFMVQRYVCNQYTLCLLVFGFTLADLGLEYLERNLEMQRDREENVRNTMITQERQRSRSTRGAKRTAYEHRGFDFDGAAGHDVVIMENLRRRMAYAFEKHLDSDLLMFGSLARLRPDFDRKSMIGGS